MPLLLPLCVAHGRRVKRTLACFWHLCPGIEQLIWWVLYAAVSEQGSVPTYVEPMVHFFLTPAVGAWGLTYLGRNHVLPL